jgi:tetratricopeptide (TPR) repeat protein
MDWRCLAVTLLAIALSGRPARGAEPSAARQAYDEATAAFGLGHYAEAAEKYETAFSLRPDPALLYDAAQAYRLAGNRGRALELYRNYLRLYPDRQNADEARNQVAALTKAIQDERIGEKTGEKALPPSPPVVAAPATAPPPPVAPPPVSAPLLLTAPPPGGAPAAIVSETPSAVESPPSTSGSRTWLWIAVGAAVVVGGAVALVLATRSDKFPDASFGSAAGN